MGKESSNQQLHMLLACLVSWYLYVYNYFPSCEFIKGSLEP